MFKSYRKTPKKRFPIEHYLIQSFFSVGSSQMLYGDFCYKTCDIFLYIHGHRQIIKFTWKSEQSFSRFAPHKAHQCIQQRHWPFHGTASRAPANSKTNWSNWPAMDQAKGCNSEPKIPEMLSNKIFRTCEQSKSLMHCQTNF